ncbi:hypothetical protein EV421DRAFT_1799307 [Armillaria borealis]|uniref:F-box domain-containing protein n=1 Tax=Armillaria borealis TaxID=47425 RepID=A0AA39JMS5_9AGAR|nr:hypothetical protein EV421DRAFT_1799307 [Armillaria borealis]
MPTENCPTCGSPGRLNLKHDDKKVLGILRAERPLLEHEHDWVHQNIATLDDHLLSLRQSLCRLESLAALIQTQIDTTSTAKQQLESISAPIRRLPRDILLEIFSLCHPGLDHKPRLATRDYPWTLGHICHWWRDIVHSSPTLWSVVILYPPYNPETVETLLQRSGNVPLSVYIFVHHPGGSTHSSTIIDRIMGLCHRWSKLELHAHASLCVGPPYVDKLPSFFPHLRTLKVLGTWSSSIVPVLDAPLLKTVRLDDQLPLQSVPNHITHLALSNLSIEELPMLLSFPNLVELHFKVKYSTQDAAPTSTITHPTIRCLSVSGTSMLPFLTLPALEHFQYVDRIRANSVISAFLSRSRCTLKTLLANMRYDDELFLELLGSQPSLCRLLIDPIGDCNHHAVIRKLSSPDFLPNLEHLSFPYVDIEAVRMIRARWYTPTRRIRTFAIINTSSKVVFMDGMEAMINEGLDVKVAEGPRRRELWLDPLMTETEDVLY